MAAEQYDYLVYMAGGKLFRGCVEAAGEMIKGTDSQTYYFDSHAYILPPNVSDDELVSGPQVFAVRKGEKQLHPVTVFAPVAAGQVRSRGYNLTSALT